MVRSFVSKSNQTLNYDLLSWNRPEALVVADGKYRETIIDWFGHGFDVTAELLAFHEHNSH